MADGGALVPGDTLGKYRLERLLGRGGMGEVWAAHDPDLDRKVALKVLRPEVAADADAQARFQREGRAMARLRHPNVIVVHDAVFTAGRGLLAMELIDGISLAGWLTARRSPAELVRVLVAAGRGLAAAHAAGMIHRDFKPHNVLIERAGRVVVTDFGLARATDEPDPGAAAIAVAIAPTDPGDDPFSGTAAAAREDAAVDATATPPASAPVPRDAALDATATPPASAPAPRDAALDATAAPPASAPAPRDAALDATAASPMPQTPKLSSSRGDLATPLTRTGMLLGTPAYMAPEQLAGEVADARADQFAFAVTAWEMFTGERPFRGRTFDELVAAVRRGDPGPGKAIPRRLYPLLVRALSRDPAARWPAMDDLLAAIERAWRRPRRLAIAAGAVAVLGALIGVVAIASTRGGPRVIEGCGDARAELATAWSPAIRAELAGRLGGPDARAIGYFDRWANKWSEIQRDNCAKPSAPDFAARSACLSSIRDEIAVVMDLRATVDPAVYAADDLPRLIPPPEGCVADPRGLAPTPPAPAVRADVARLRADLAVVRLPLVFGPRGTTDVPETGPLLARAVGTGYAPVIVEARMMDAIAGLRRARSARDLTAACPTFGTIAAEAEAAGYERMVVEALLLQLQCLELTHSIDAPAVLQRLDAITRRTGNPIQRADVERTLAGELQDQGRYDEALRALAHARGVYEEHTMSEAIETRRLEAITRLYRDRGDDLDLAAALLREEVAAAPGSGAVFWLRSLEWRRGHLEDAPPPRRPPAPPADPVALTITVVDDRGPVAGAAIAAAVGLTADATHAAMVDVADPVLATTDANGVATVQVARGAVVLARAGAAAGAVAARDRDGAVTIRLGPTAEVAGEVEGLASPDGDPTDLAGRAVRRRLATANLTTTIGGRTLTWAAPVDRAGRWQLPAVIPGAYLLSVQCETGLGDEVAVQQRIELRAGPNPPVHSGFGAAPHVLEVLIRPRIESLVVAIPGGGPAPGSWPLLRDRLPAATSVAIGYPETPGLDVSGARAGDQLARLGVDGGPTTVCVVPGGDTAHYGPLSGLSVAAGGAPPACAVVDAASPVTQVVIPTR